MKYEDYRDFLAVDSICVIKRGDDEGRLVRVLHIEDDCGAVLVKTVSTKPLVKGRGFNHRLKLTNWRDLDLYHGQETKG